MEDGHEIPAHHGARFRHRPVARFLLQQARPHREAAQRNPQGKYTLIFLAAPESPDAELELTYNWEPESYGEGRNFGHLAFAVDDIYATCQRLADKGVTINRPPRDGRMAFVRSPDNISVELLQKGEAKPPQEPWASMANTGHW
jgi:lactoylglutathione lyase